MEYKNQTENRAFQEMLQAAVKRLQNRAGEEIAAKSGAVFHSSRNVLEVLSFYETIEIQLPEFRINSERGRMALSDIAALSGYGRWHRRLTEAHYFW